MMRKGVLLFILQHALFFRCCMNRGCQEIL